MRGTRGREGKGASTGNEGLKAIKGNKGESLIGVREQTIGDSP